MKDNKQNGNWQLGISLTLISIAALIIMYFFYLLFLTPPVLEVKQQPLKLRPTTVKPGDIVTVTIDYCKSKVLMSDIEVQFIGDVVVPSNSTVRNLPIGCHVKNLKVVLPDAIKPGEYTIAFNIEYRANRLKREHHLLETNPIQVVQ